MTLTDCDKIFEKIRTSNNPEIISSGFQELFSFYPLLNYKIGRGSIYWRGRPSKPEGYSSIEDLHCPPETNAKVGRLNERGKPCLYAATRRTTIFKELNAQENEYVHIVGLRMLSNKSIRLIAIGDLFHVYKTGHTRSLGRDPDKCISKLLNKYDRKLAEKILYVDAFLGEILADENAKNNDYLITRLLAATAYEKSGARGMFYPSVQDYVGMNLSINSEDYFSNMHIVCSQVVKITKVRPYGFYDYEVIKQSEGIDNLNSFIWTDTTSDKHVYLFNLTKKEIEFASSRDSEDPNLLLDFMGVS